MSPDKPTPSNSAPDPKKDDRNQKAEAETKANAEAPGQAEAPSPDIDDGPAAGPVDEIQAALFEAAQAGLSPDVDLDELGQPQLDLDELDSDEVQEALRRATQEGMAAEVDFDTLPAPSLSVGAPEKSETSAPAKTPAKKAPPSDKTAAAKTAASKTKKPSSAKAQPAPSPRPVEPDPLPAISDFWLLLALFVAFRYLTLLLLKPGGFIRDWSDFDTYFGIASLSDYGLYPFFDFWLEWPPLVPWLAVSAYKLSLSLPPWPDDPRLWFILILGLAFVLFEIGNFVLIYRLARRLFRAPATVIRVMWMYALLFPPVYAMLGFFDGVALFFILLALELLLADRRFLSAVTVGIGVMVKLVPGLVALVAIRNLWYRYRANNREAGIEAGLYAVICGLTVMVLLAPFLFAGPQWVLGTIRSMLGRSSWETVWALLEGYYGFGLVLGNRFNPAETGFAVHQGWLPWWLISLAFAGLYGLLFVRSADYNRPRSVLAFAGLTIDIFLIYAKGYSPQFLVYLLPFILLLMPTGRGLTYALILTGLNVLEQPIYFVMLPDAEWLLIFVVMARLLVHVVLLLEFATILWPARIKQTLLIRIQQAAPAALGSAAVLALLILTPLNFSAYAASRLDNSSLGTLSGFMELQAANSGDAPPPRLLLSEQTAYRQLYPHLANSLDLRLADGLTRELPNTAGPLDLIEGRSRIWMMPTGPQAQILRNPIRTRGTELAAYDFEGLGTVSLYSFEQNPLPRIAPARFIGGIELLAHNVTIEANAVDVTLYWRARSPQNQRLTIFAQLLNNDGERVAGHDSIPGNGSRPITGWPVDAVQADPHRIQLPTDIPPGDYTLIVGLYNDFNERVRGIDPGGAGFANQAVPLQTVRLQ